MMLQIHNKYEQSKGHYAQYSPNWKPPTPQGKPSRNGRGRELHPPAPTIPGHSGAVMGPPNNNNDYNENDGFSVVQNSRRFKKSRHQLIAQKLARNWGKGKGFCQDTDGTSYYIV